MDNYYFTEETEDAIVAYNQESDQLKRNQLYTEKIEVPIKEIISFYVNKFNRAYIDQSIEDAQNDVMAHFHSNIHLYEKGKGKAYSYFSVMIRNMLMYRNKQIYKKLVKSDVLDSVDSERNVVTEIVNSEDRAIKSSFLPLFIEYLDKHSDKLFLESSEIAVADTFSVFMKNSESYEDYNKKQLYHLIKERTGLSALFITKTLKKVQAMYLLALIEYKHYENLNRLNPNVLLTKTRKLK